LSLQELNHDREDVEAERSIPPPSHSLPGGYMKREGERPWKEDSKTKASRRWNYRCDRMNTNVTPWNHDSRFILKRTAER